MSLFRPPLQDPESAHRSFMWEVRAVFGATILSIAVSVLVLIVL